MAARKYSQASSRKVGKAMHERKKGTLKSGSGRKVKSKKQAIAIGLSQARKEGKKVPKKKKYEHDAISWPRLAPPAPIISVGSSSGIDSISLNRCSLITRWRVSAIHRGRGSVAT